MRPRWFGLGLLFLISAHGCAWAAPTQEAEAYFERAIALIQEKHINSGSVDWPAIKAKAANKISDAETTAETYDAIRFVLAELGEKHSFLREPRTPSRPASEPSAGLPRQMPPLPSWRVVGGRFGFIQLPELDTIGENGKQRGSQYAAESRAGLIAMDRSQLCGWILDLRDNGGGNMWPMLQGLDPLLGKAPFGFFAQSGAIIPWVRTPSGVFPESAPMPDSAPSFSLTHQDAPLAVLIGPGTASSGEMTALAFVGRRNVHTFGAPSAGFTTGNVPYPLSDGAFLVITQTKVRDRSRKDYIGPVIPDEQVPLADAERAASAWLGSNCSTPQRVESER